MHWCRCWECGQAICFPNILSTAESWKCITGNKCSQCSQRVGLTLFVFEEMPATYPSQLATPTTTCPWNNPRTPAEVPNALPTRLHSTLKSTALPQEQRTLPRHHARPRVKLVRWGWEHSVPAGRCDEWVYSNVHVAETQTCLISDKEGIAMNIVLQTPRACGPHRRNCGRGHPDNSPLPGYHLLTVKNVFLGNKFPACCVGQFGPLGLVWLDGGFPLTAFCGIGPWILRRTQDCPAS